LASASPRRQALIGLLGLEWFAAPSHLDEDQYLHGDPALAAVTVALAKARSISSGKLIVVAADTVVALDGECLGKPVDAEAATHMLRALRGREHDVLTGVALRAPDGREWLGAVSTRVAMREYRDADIATYVTRGEPFDKAGGYAVQDTEFRPAHRLIGCYLNVVGLPLCAVVAGLEALGAAVPNRPPNLRAPCELCAAGLPLVQTGELAQDPRQD
jgi:septum formation protein